MKVAAKRKKRQQKQRVVDTSKMGNIPADPIMSSGSMMDHSATLKLPKIAGSISPKAAKRRDTMALVDESQDHNSSSMLDLGSIQQPRVTADISLKPSSTHEVRGITTNISELDGQLLELPPLSPGAINNQHSLDGGSSMVMTDNKKYLQQKDGFECANDMSDR